MTFTKLRTGNRFNGLKAIALMLCLSLLAVCFTACSEPQIINGAFEDNPSKREIASQMIAENDRFELSWDNDAHCILLYDKQTGKTWSDINYDLFKDGSMNGTANSAIKITVSDPVTLSWNTYDIYSSRDEGATTAYKKIENGIKITYYFPDACVSIPVDYTLNSDSLKISIKGSDIKEQNDKLQLVSVQVAPFMCSTENSADNYLFVPSGTGALMYADERPDGEREYSGEVYGEDAARRIAEYYTDTEAVRLSIFGARDSGGAIMAIIDKNAGSTVVNAVAGSEKMGRSYVYSEFYFRGYDRFRYGSHAFGQTILTRISKSIYQDEISVSYYPLADANAGYNEMAAFYKDYLKKNGMTKQETGYSPYALSFLGGTEIDKSFLGIPTTERVALTTFDEASDMISAANQKTGITPTVLLKGFGDGGINAGSIAGGKSFASVFGGNKAYKNLVSAVSKLSGNIYNEIDVIRYSKAANGFSLKGDAAKTPSNYTATQYRQDPIRAFDEDISYKILSRTQLSKAVDLAIKNSNRRGSQGIALSTLTSYAYSDYKNLSYGTKAGMAEQVTELLNKVKSSGLSLAASSANDYAAALSDVIFDTPIYNGDYNALDVEIPFYQMVFGGSRPMYSSAINNATDYDRHLMLSAIGGMGISYEIIGKIEIDSKDLKTDKLYSLNWDYNLKNITKTLIDSKYADFYNSIAGEEIERYEIINSALSCTTFANGVKLYANHGYQKIDSPVGELSGFGFAVADRGDE